MSVTDIRESKPNFQFVGLFVEGFHFDSINAPLQKSLLLLNRQRRVTEIANPFSEFLQPINPDTILILFLQLCYNAFLVDFQFQSVFLKILDGLLKVLMTEITYGTFSV